MAELKIPDDELVGWCSSCDKLCCQSEYPTSGFDDENATCSSCGDTLITKDDEDHEKLIERIDRAETENAALKTINIKQADDLLEANMAWVGKCEEVTTLKAENERLKARIQAYVNTEYIFQTVAEQVQERYRELKQEVESVARASAPATGAEQVHAPTVILPEPAQRRIETELVPKKVQDNG